MSTPGTGDRGQRFEVTYLDPKTGTRKTFGWADTRKGAETFAGAIRLHPTMQDPEIRDRVAC